MENDEERSDAMTFHVWPLNTIWNVAVGDIFECLLVIIVDPMTFCTNKCKILGIINGQIKIALSRIFYFCGSTSLLLNGASAARGLMISS